MYREEESKLLFEGELLGIAQSIAESPTTLYHSQKSQLLKRFDKLVTIPQFCEAIPSAIIIELSAIIQIKASCSANTFHEFAVIIYYHILELARDFSRIDIVCDQYFDNSLKEGTREGRGNGIRKVFTDNTKFPMNNRCVELCT